MKQAEIKTIMGKSQKRPFIKYALELLDRVLKSPWELKKGLIWETASTENNSFTFSYIEKITTYKLDAEAGVHRLSIEFLQRFYPNLQHKYFDGEFYDEAFRELGKLVKTFIKKLNKAVRFSTTPRLSELFFTDVLENDEFWICVAVHSDVFDGRGFIHQDLKKQLQQQLDDL